MTTEPTRIDLALLVIGVAGVSSSGPLMAAAVGVPALAMSFWRTGLGALAIAPTALLRHGVEIRALPRGQLRRIVFAGLMLACHFAAWTSSLKYTSVASATALVCLQAAWVVVLARIGGERPRGRVWLGLAVAFAGVLVVSGVDLSTSTRALGGDLLALAGGVFAAVYTVVGGQVRQTTSTAPYILLCYATSAVVLLAAVGIGRVELVGFSGRDWLIVVSVTVTAQLLGHSVFNHLLAVMSPTLISMVVLLEVPGAALLAAVFLGQAPPLAVYVGLALICAGLAVVVATRRGVTVPVESS